MNARVLNKWDDCLVAAGREPAPETVEEFDRVLADAVDEDRKNNPSIWVAGKVSWWSVRA